MTNVEVDTTLAYAVLPPGDDAQEATVEWWYIEPGSQVGVGDPVALLRTERFAFDVPAHAAGDQVVLLADPGDHVTVGAPLLQAVMHDAEAETPAAHETLPVRQRATPLARKIAQLHGYDLGEIKMTANGGRIRSADVRSALSTQGVATNSNGVHTSVMLPLPDALPAPTVSDMSIQRPLAKDAPPLLVQAPPAWWSADHQHASLYAITAFEVDLARVADMVNAQRIPARRKGAHINIFSYIAYAVVQSLIEHPHLNSRWGDAGLIRYGRVDVGVTRLQGKATNFEIIRNAADLSLPGLAQAIADCASSQPNHDHAAPNASAATFVINETTTAGSWWNAPVPNVPITAMLSVGAVMPRAVVMDTPRGASINIHPCAVLTLTYDIRCVTHAEADAFLQATRNRVQDGRQV